MRSIDVPRARPQGDGRFDPASRKARRKKLDIVRALEAIGEPCVYRLVMSDGTPIPSGQVTDQDSAEIFQDLDRLAAMDPISLEALLTMLYSASSHEDRSRVASALDHMLACVDHWSSMRPARVVALFERLEPSRLVRAVGQTLLASTRLDRDRSPARRDFLSRFLEDLRVRGVPEARIARLRQGLEA